MGESTFQHGQKSKTPLDVGVEPGSVLLTEQQTLLSVKSKPGKISVLGLLGSLLEANWLG